MPTIQHGLIRSTIGTLVWALRGVEYNIPTMRKVADVGSMLFFMPAGVETEQFYLDHIACEWIIPRKADHNKVLLYLHGGGYAVGSMQTHRALVAEIARRAGICALIPEYRLAPEFPFPAAMNDALRCYEWLLETGHDPSHIVLAGDSAGGGLALACLLAVREKGLPMPACQVLISPWVDLTVSRPSIYAHMERTPMFYLREMKTWARNYAGDLPKDHPMVSPLYADLRGLPPMLLQMSDMEVLTDEDMELAERARAAGVAVDHQISHGLMHVWHIYWRYLEQSRDAIGKVVDFIAAQAGH